MPSSGNSQRCLFLLLCLVLAYIGVWGLEYSTDLLGRSPVLDARENLAWVDLIRAGDVPAEPMYRALLYPWLLSVLPFSAASLPLVAILLGLMLHLLNTWLVGRLAGVVWKSTYASWVSAFLYAVYPVALYFAVQVLDVTFATTLFLAALLCLLLPAKRPDYWRLLAGTLIGLAVLARPNFLLVALVMPFVALFCSKIQSKWSCASAAAVACPVMLLLIGQGLFNAKLSGEFRILPWQGSYNLYAANKTGANGRYFAQQVSFEELPVGVNPTRVESELLFQRALGTDAELSVDAMSAYWRGELLSDISSDPLRWLGLMGRKAVFLLNDWEQYNNLSYVYQKERLLMLRLNPLGWGLLLLLASVALLIAWKQGDYRSLLAVGTIGLVYAAGVLLFFVSARFRIPLAPLLCIAVGGLVYARRGFALKRIANIGIPILVLNMLAYGNWFGARDTSTFIQDQALLAISASQQANDMAALEYAGRVLEQNPMRQDMQRIEVTSYFNLWLEADSDRDVYWNALKDTLDGLKDHDAATYFIAGVSAWRSKEKTAAVDLWTQGLVAYGNQAQTCAAALQAIGESAPPQPAALVQQIRSLLLAN